jgi:O-antigen ligase
MPARVAEASRLGDWMAAEASPSTRAALAQHVVRAAICIAILGAGFALDSAAFDGFDAPKRLIATLGAAVAMAALLIAASPGPSPSMSRAAKICAIAACLAVGGLLVSTLTASDSEAARASLREVVLFLLFLPLGASVALDAPRGRVVLWALALAIGVNAALSLLQAAGASLPIELARVGGRYPTGALLGNEGYVALACALALPGSLALALSSTRAGLRTVAWAGLVVGIATIAVNRQLTAALAAVAGLLAVALLHRGWVRALRAVLLTAFVGSLMAFVPPLRALTVAPWLDAQIPALQQATTYRLGAWAAADGMWRARPWTGFGLGAFEAQSQHYRLAAEERLRTRLVPPPNATHFVQAHNDYLQLAAEAGIPTLAAMLVALVTLIIASLRRAVRDSEARALSGILIAGAVAALAWFPLQIPLLAIGLLLAAGRAWRLIAAKEDSA